ncbi:MAG: Spx/MgsR family RNA polymerase-binding regulatory protein [Opitutaceae bacterium]|jgi:arsenate reductase (glutaredoxin)|nr:Spx/MgsR family RNA polymerase-binding regulatory protein [Opitutaceae bacterium]
MKPLVVYTYKKCSTCRKAVKWLEVEGITFQEKPIRETPPSQVELKRMLAAQDGNLKKLFNTSGGDYRELKLGPKLETMPAAEAFALLNGNGNLVKRPFLLTGDTGLVGFKEDLWAAALT